jgi:polysaccharide deacetylase family protein (PEP-CTERM system associated)
MADSIAFPTVSARSNMLNAITVDVEDYFHPTEIQAYVAAAEWHALPSRVEQTTMRVLELFARHETHGTFFVLGWVARRCPRLIREIAAQGHEIGCHSYAHRLVYELNPDQFRTDTIEAQGAISDACGLMPRIYRAPSYSITERSWWALDVLASCGFTHDSSVVPISHDRYGVPGFGRFAQVLTTSSGPLIEVPVATARISSNRISPVGGGAYLRLLPYRYTAAGIRSVNRHDERPACVYFHPWEIDEDQPRLAKKFLARIRTYTGLGGMYAKLDRLLSEFQFSTLGAVYPADQLIPSRVA